MPSSVGHRRRLLRRSLPGRVSAVGSGLERGGGESLGCACGPMTTTPSGVVYLFEGVILPPFSSLSSCLPGENLDHVGPTTTAPVASFPSWRRCLGSFAGGGHLLSLESFCFCVCLCFISSALSGSRLVVGFSSLADTLPPWLVDQVDALPPLLGCRPLHPGCCCFCL